MSFVVFCSVHHITSFWAPLEHLAHLEHLLLLLSVNLHCLSSSSSNNKTIIISAPENSALFVVHFFRVVFFGGGGGSAAVSVMHVNGADYHSEDEDVPVMVINIDVSVDAADVLSHHHKTHIFFTVFLCCLAVQK